MNAGRNSRNAWAASARILLYLVAVLTPLTVAAVLRPQAADSFVCELSRNLALLAFSILSMQFVLSARFKWIERPFGLDILFQFHKAMGIFAAVLLLAHPILLVVCRGWVLLLDMTWYILAGKVSLLLLLILGFVSLFRLAVRLEYERWRRWHNILAGLALVAGLVHGWNAGLDLLIAPTQVPIRLVWIVTFGLAAWAYIYHRAVRPLWRRRHAYRVVEVLGESHDVWTVKFAPPEGEERYDYLPGQFHFITLYRGNGLPVEEHPFTISSSPTERGLVSSTIKASGDFTATIGQTQPGDRAALQGPYGRFSYVLHPEESELVFIAGGVGITPLMSMLRYMRDTQAEKDVLLLYGNKTESDIVFGNELSEMEAGDYPRLKVVHILSMAGDDWSGETGYVDRKKIERFCGSDLGNKGFYVCGPPAMMNGVLQALKDLGVREDHIHYERFSL